jgi:hypothetical protein
MALSRLVYNIIILDDGIFHIREISRYASSRRQFDVTVASPFSRLKSQRKSNLMIFQDEPLKYTNTHSDIHGLENMDSAHTCQSPPIEAKITSKDSFFTDIFRRAPPGCPATKMILPMGVAADCTYIQQHGGTAKALAQILSNFNQASVIYERTFNVQLGITRVVMKQTCYPTNPDAVWNQQCSPDYTIAKRLSDFSKWRSEQVEDTNGLWQLVSNCPTLPSVGIAWLGQLCETGLTTQGSGARQQFVSGTSVATIVPVEWKVTAHEIGHNFGAEHDCTKNTCPCLDPSACGCIACSPNCNCDGQFIMHPLDNAASDNFSPGSINRICSSMSAKQSCLKDSNSFVSGLLEGICGNGVKEGQEECDCGQPQDCRDKCCNPQTCKLTSGSQCSDGNDSCCSSCLVKAAGTPCYKKTNQCDQDLVLLF